VFVKVHAKPGDHAAFAGKGGQLLVDGILSHKDPKQLERDVAQLRKLVTIQVARPF
jgi:hypothetical protein